MAREALHWDDVRLFLALCRARTAGSAAAALGIDTSTVSRRLVALEEAIGSTLFDRGRDGIAATKAAEDLLPIAERIEEAMNGFASAVDGLERDVSGVVRVTSPPDVAEVVLVPVLRELLTKHPGLRIEIDPAEAVLDLSRREADIGLRIMRPTRGDLLVTRLLEMRWVLAATPQVAKDLEKVKSWSQVPWIGWGERLSMVGPARWLTTHVEGADPIARSDSLLVQVALVRAGVGAALLPEPSLSHYGLEAVTLAPKLRESAAAWPTNELFLVTHRALRDVPRVRAVWELLVERVGERSSRVAPRPRGRT